MTRVKICCIASRTEAEMAIKLGASAIGLVSEMPSGPGVITESRIAEIAAAVPPPVNTFLLTSRRDPDGVVSQVRRCGVNTVQLCDRLEPAARTQIRRELPGVSIVQVVHVGSDDALTEARDAEPTVDAILLDSGRRDGPVNELGGTGRTHDWALSRRIRDAIEVPVYLAGGLHPGNVAEGIEAVRPYAVDVCSGLRRDDRLDESLLSGFMREVARIDGSRERR